MAKRDQAFLDALIAAEQDQQRRMAVVNEQPRLRDLPSDAIRGLLDPMLRADLGINDALDYYLGPTGIPDRVRAIGGLLDPGVYDTGYAAADLIDPRVSDAERQMAAQTVGMAAALAPVMFLRGGSGLANDAVQSARDDARRFVERLNQPGPMPTTYSNPIPGLRAFHGSPHDFDKFSMDKIGTGEGAQAYGHGLYFAEAEDTALSYKNSLTRNSDELRRMAEETGGLSGDAAEMLSYQFSMNNFHGKGFDKWLDDIKTAYDADELSGRAKAAAEQIIAREVDASEAVRKMRAPGSMYEVNINANPDDFLDWDKPLSEQPEGMVDKLRSAGLDVRDKSVRPPFYGLQSEASVAPLREAGIPGIRYLDAGSRGAGDGSRNYVVFDENLINIVRKYGIAGAAAMLGMSQYDVAQAMEQQQPQGLLGYGVQ